MDPGGGDGGAAAASTEPGRAGRSLKLGARALAVAAVAGLLALLVWKIVSDRGGAASALERGEHPRAPGWTLDRLDRPGRLSLASLQGKVVVLNFWASWCIPCKKEAPRLEAAWRRFRSQGVVVVGIDSQDFKGDARRFMRRYKVSYPIVHDGPGTTLDDYGLTGFPETFFVRRDGRLTGERIQGEIREEQLTRNIRLALGE